jgi:Putative prokaryotic signal transducing protein
MVMGEAEAELVCGLLRAEDIRCFHRATLSVEAWTGINDWREILVAPKDLERARALLEASVPAVDECVRCGRTMGEGGGWFPDESGDLQPYCAVCAERLFGPA